MADNRQISTDSDAAVESTVGVGQVDQTTKALHQLQPNWMEDGYGIVGPQRPRIPYRNARPTPMDFGIDNSRHTPPADNASCTPHNPPEEGTHVWGAVDGECQWIDTTDCTA